MRNPSSGARLRASLNMSSLGMRGSRLSRSGRAERARRASDACDDFRVNRDFDIGAGFRPGFDPCALLRRAADGAVGSTGKGCGGTIAVVRSGRGRFWGGTGERGKLSAFGDVIVVSELGGDFDSGGERVIKGAFSVGKGSEITTVGGKGGKGWVLKVRRGKEWVEMRFGDEGDMRVWEAVVAEMTRKRVGRVEDFEIIAPIGKGASGKVFMVRDRVGGGRYAMKVVPKDRVYDSRSSFRHAMDERLALEAMIGVQGATQMKLAFQTRGSFYFIMDFCEGGDIYQFLKARGGCLQEDGVRGILAEVVVAMQALHSKGYVYRDLKTENVLLSNDGHVRLADFGLSKFLPQHNPLTTTTCGTHTFISIEMLSQLHYGKSVDLWAFGIFAFYLLNGRTPFEAHSLERVIAKLNKRVIRFRSETSKEFVNLVKRLLDWTPSTRLGCGSRGWTEVKEHPFFAGVDWAMVGRHSVHGRAQKRESFGNESAKEDVLDACADVGSPVSCSSVYSSSWQTKRASDAGTVHPGSPMTPDRQSPSSTSSHPLRSESRPESCHTAALDRDGDTPNPVHHARTVTVDTASMNNDEIALRNFDVGLWRDTVSVDPDYDNPHSDQLWPVRSSRRPLLDPHFIVGFNFCGSDEL